MSKITTIDELQISRPHEDHFTDIEALSKKTIRSFRCPSLKGYTDDEIAWRNHDKRKVEILRRLKQTLPAIDVAVTVGNGFSHTVWYPGPEARDEDDPNTAGTATVLSYGSFKMLFGADLTETCWESLLRNNQFRMAIRGTTVLKVSHHGREVGCSQSLLNLIGPTLRLCVISDKTIDDTNENTESVQWYRDRTLGTNIVSPNGVVASRWVLTTRNDKSIFFATDQNGTWKCKLKTRLE